MIPRGQLVPHFARGDSNRFIPCYRVKAGGSSQRVVFNDWVCYDASGRFGRGDTRELALWTYTHKPRHSGDCY